MQELLLLDAWLIQHLGKGLSLALAWRLFSSEQFFSSAYRAGYSTLNLQDVNGRMSKGFE